MQDRGTLGVSSRTCQQDATSHHGFAEHCIIPLHTTKCPRPRAAHSQQPPQADAASLRAWRRISPGQAPKEPSQPCQPSASHIQTPARQGQAAPLPEAEGTRPAAGLQARRLPAAQPPPAPLLGRPAQELAPLPLLAAAAVPAGRRRSPTAALQPRHPGRATAEPSCQERCTAPRAAATTQTASSELEQGGEGKKNKIQQQQRTPTLCPRVAAQYPGLLLLLAKGSSDQLCKLQSNPAASPHTARAKDKGSVGRAESPCPQGHPQGWSHWAGS